MIGKSRPKPNSPINKKDSKIKFNVSRTYIQCFLPKTLGAKSASKKIVKPNTLRTPYHEEKLQLKTKVQKTQKMIKNIRLSNSPDLVIVSNTIIKPIEQQGTGFQWKQNDSSSEKRNKKPDSSPDEGPLFNPTWSASFSSLGSSKKSFKNSQQTKHSNLSFSNPSSARNISYTSPFDGYYLQNFKPQTNNNNVILEQIIYDLRTTIYIRHIPNKYSLQQLEDQLDKTHKNTYDFLHLPYDYQNNCNRGYAFINFIKKEDIIQFYKIYHGRKWDRFNSSKICEIKYASIQGKDSLINHFHDTKVFTQKQKKFRPIFKNVQELDKVEENKNQP